MGWSERLSNSFPTFPVEKKGKKSTNISGFSSNAKVFVRKESFLKIDPLLWSSSDSGAQSKSVATVDIRDSLLFS